eukprot:806611-Rhodomonas_salina.2
MERIADIIALMEIENDGFEQYSAISNLTGLLNHKAGCDKEMTSEGYKNCYEYITPAESALTNGAIGTDAIAVGIIYRPVFAVPDQAGKVLDSSVDVDFLDTKNRPALAQSFKPGS